MNSLVKKALKCALRPLVRPIADVFNAARKTRQMDTSKLSGARWDLIPPFRIDPRFFALNLTFEERKKLFKENVEYIYIEPHSFCNRKCWFCPNSMYSRGTTMHKMEDGMFHKILNELSEIDYDGDISFSLYNEPLADNNLEEIRIKPLKNILKNCKLIINTNGDFLDYERLKKLESAGLDNLMVSIYGITDKIDYQWNSEVAEDAIRNKAKSLGMSAPTFTSGDSEKFVTTADFFGNMNVVFIAQNFHISGYDRGMLLSDKPFPKIDCRQRLCVTPYVQIAIGYNGDVQVCSNIYPESIEHKFFIVGNIIEKSIYNIYTSDRITEFRKKSIENINIFPCKTCIVDTDMSIFNQPNAPLRNRPRYRIIQ